VMWRRVMWRRVMWRRVLCHVMCPCGLGLLLQMTVLVV